MKSKPLLAAVLSVAGVAAGLWAGPAHLPPAWTAKSSLPRKIIGQEQAGYWHPSMLGPDGMVQTKLEPYFPRAGDLLLFDDHNKPITFLYRLAGSGPPLHAATIIQRPDGSPAVLEAGPNFIPKVFILDPYPRLSSYPGDIVIRRPRQPLTLEQSANLTAFALAQEGKDYALVRLFLQGTPLRCRVGLRKVCFGSTNLDRARWTCSEITVAAATVAGLLDPRRHPANAMYPGDLAHDRRYNLSEVYHSPIPWSATVGENPKSETPNSKQIHNSKSK